MPSRWIMPVMLSYSLDKDWAMWVTTLFYLSIVCVWMCLPHNYRSILVHILLSPPVFYYHSVCVKPDTDVLFIVTQPSLTNLWSVRGTGPFLLMFFHTGYLTLFKVACRSMYILVHNATKGLNLIPFYQRPLSPSFVFFVTQTPFSHCFTSP